MLKCIGKCGKEVDDGGDFLFKLNFRWYGDWNASQKLDQFVCDECYKKRH